MSKDLAVWILIVGVGASNYVLRLSFIALFARREMPGWMSHALRYVAPAVLAAILVPAVVFDAGGRVALEPSNLRLLAAIAAAAAAWKTRSPVVTIVVGMVALWSLQAFA